MSKVCKFHEVGLQGVEEGKWCDVCDELLGSQEFKWRDYEMSINSVVLEETHPEDPNAVLQAVISPDYEHGNWHWIVREMGLDFRYPPFGQRMIRRGSESTFEQAQETAEIIFATFKKNYKPKVVVG